MLKSMTGFGAATVENDDYKVTVELKAVNQRFLELCDNTKRKAYRLIRQLRYYRFQVLCEIRRPFRHLSRAHHLT